MDDRSQAISVIQAGFLNCREILIAIGDDVRQSILLALLQNTCKGGMRVGEITACTHLSRPAISHHLKILKDAGVVYMEKVGTMTFYRINVHSFDALQELLFNIDAAVKEFY